MGATKLKSVPGTVWMFVQIFGAACVSTFFESLSFAFVRPFSLNQHRRICIFFSRCFFLCSTALLEDWSGITFKSYGDRLDPKLSSLAIVNHRSDVDWLLGLSYIARLGYPYPGNAKSVTKASLGKVPIFGSVLRFAGFLFLTRDWTRDRQKFLRDLLALRNYSECGYPMWFVLYPEGTRFTAEKREYSRAYAERINRRAPDHVLFPRFKAFTSIVSTLRDNFDGIVDATFMFGGNEPSLKASLAGTDSSEVHVHLKYYPMKDIPQGEEKLEEWLLERWYEKDERIGNFLRDPSSLGPADDFFANKKPSAEAFRRLGVLFGLASLATIYALSQIRNGLLILFASTIVAISMTALFVVANVRPSKKGSGRSTRRR